MGVGTTIYSGAAGFGRFYAIFSAIISTLIGISLIIAGIIMLQKKKIYTHKVLATIIKDGAQCSTETHHDRHGSTTTYNCSLHLSYVVNNKTYINTLAVDSSTDYEGYKTIEIYYNPHNPMDAKVQPFPWKLGGWVALIIGILLVIFPWFWVWVTQKYKFAAALSGVRGGLRIL